jgi:hypothetical protein
MEGSDCGLICLEGTKKATKSHSQDSRTQIRDLNSGYPEHEAEELTVRAMLDVSRNS